MGEQLFGRREGDDVLARGELATLIELRTDVRNLIERIGREFGEFRDGLTADRNAVNSRFDAHNGRFEKVEKRIDDLEKRADRQDGAMGSVRAMLVVAYSAGMLTAALVGLWLHNAGHI